MDVVQIILASAVVILTAILTLVGFEVFLIFKELRRSVQKINKILNDAGLISETITHQITGVSGLVKVVETAVDLIRIFFRKAKEKAQFEEENSLAREPQRPPSLQKEATSGSLIRRFFTRAGKKLS